ncbi:MAG: SGNH/GDSL hydrolase family protein, partial [Microbacterium sp.]
GPSGASYYREHVGPWVKRRVTRTSSGDGRAAKYPAWVERVPQW